MQCVSKDKENATGYSSKDNGESDRLKRLEEFRKPIIDEVMAEHPGLSKKQLIKMMDEMGF